jgi:hypothetical protein
LTKKNNPIDHHFIPQFYLKGFYNEVDKVFAYKKKYGDIKEWSAAQILYKKNLHTLEKKGQTSLAIENFFSEIESQFSTFVRVLNECLSKGMSFNHIKDNPAFHQTLQLMIGLQFWRVPSHKELAKNAAEDLLSIYESCEKHTFDSFPLDRSFIQHLFNNRKNESTMKIIQFIVLPIITFSPSRKTNINWYFFLAENSKVAPFMTSDNPVVYENFKGLFDFERVYFPISKDLLVMGSLTKIEKPLLNISRLHYDLVKNATNIVVSPLKSQLQEFKKTNKAFKNRTP